MPLGHNKLNSVVKTMMSEAGVQGQKEKDSTVKGNSNSALTSALAIPGSSGTLVVNISGGNCNITINNNYELLEGKCL